MVEKSSRFWNVPRDAKPGALVGSQPSDRATLIADRAARGLDGAGDRIDSR
jgi:hypothetical protein